MTFLEPDAISRIYSERIFDIVGTTRQKRKILCPLPGHQHNNYTPSFSIFWTGDRWRWICFGNCDRQGDVIDLIGYMQVPLYDKQNHKKLAQAIEILTGKHYEPVPPTPPKKRIRLSPLKWQEYYPPGPEVEEYACKRGIGVQTLHQFRCGQCVDEFGKLWMSIPNFHHNKLVGIKLRNLQPNGLRYRSIEGSRTGLFNYDAVSYTTERVYVAKGEIAAMVLTENGLLACAPTGGESMAIPSWMVKILARADVVVIGDNDRDPEVRRRTAKLAEERAKILNAKLFFPPEEYKDVDEWILDDPLALSELRGL